MKLSRYEPAKPATDEWLSGTWHSFQSGARGVASIEATDEGVIVTLETPVRQRDGTMSPGRLIFAGGGMGRIDDSKGKVTKAAESKNWMTGSDIA
jgi:hypothetical protein